MVAGEGTTERLQVTIEWVGGRTTAGVITRPIGRIEHLSDYARLCARIRALARAGYDTAQIMACLARERFRAPKSLAELMQRLAVQPPCCRQRLPLRQHELWLSDLARVVGVSHATQHRWWQYG